MSNWRAKYFESETPLSVTEQTLLQHATRILRVFLATALSSLALGAQARDEGTKLAPAELEEHQGLSERTEVGPFFYSFRSNVFHQWAVPPLMSYAQDEELPSTEFDVLYPLLTYDRFGEEYRFQVLQWFSLAGGSSQSGTNRQRFSVFPFYLQQRSADDTQDYTSVFPFYGRLQNRFFRDEIFYLLWPGYVQSRKRDVVTDNYLLPFFHLRRGEALRGWQLWPIAGHETKQPLLKTNAWVEAVTVPGHERRFVLWPFFLDQRAGIGSTNEQHTQALLPFYSFTRSPLRDATAVPFVLGWSSIEDRGRGYREIGAPWPLLVFRRGEHAHTTRVWPFFSHATNRTLQSTWYAWPIYRYNRLTAAPLDRERTRILLFLYSDIVERNTEAGTQRTRRELWPLFVHRRDWEGNERLQILALLEPLLPQSDSIERNYSPLWSLWRDERNAKTGARHQSLLWNLYQRHAGPLGITNSALFGLVQHSSEHGWRVFFLPRRQASACDCE
jgi:hypothetical protein